MKTIFTPRDELVCGKLDKLQDGLQKLAVIKSVKNEAVNLIYLLNDIRHDCERMELKLIERKAEVRRLTEPETIDLIKKANKKQLNSPIQ